MINLKLYYKGYENLMIVYNNIYNKYFRGICHIKDKIMIGGSIEIVKETIEIVKNKYKINIKIDMFELTNDEDIRIVILSNDEKTICASFSINEKLKITEIMDLHKCKDYTTSNILSTILHISKMNNIKIMRLLDNAYHNCTGTVDRYNLDIGSTLTKGKPYYYRYGFIYENENEIVKYNYRKLKKYKCSDFKKMIRPLFYTIGLNYYEKKTMYYKIK